MGWSCTVKASDAMDKIQAACRETQTETKENRPSNVYHANGERYFFEATRRDQPDGGVSGSIHLCIGETLCRKVATFRIDGQGNVVRGPKLFRDAVAGR
jgi:hypothetical protein